MINQAKLLDGFIYQIVSAKQVRDNFEWFNKNDHMTIR